MSAQVTIAGRVYLSHLDPHPPVEHGGLRYPDLHDGLYYRTPKEVYFLDRNGIVEAVLYHHEEGDCFFSPVMSTLGDELARCQGFGRGFPQRFPRACAGETWDLLLYEPTVTKDDVERVVALAAQARNVRNEGVLRGYAQTPDEIRNLYKA